MHTVYLTCHYSFADGERYAVNWIRRLHRAEVFIVFKWRPTAVRFDFRRNRNSNKSSQAKEFRNKVVSANRSWAEILNGMYIAIIVIWIISIYNSFFYFHIIINIYFVVFFQIIIFAAVITNVANAETHPEREREMSSFIFFLSRSLILDVCQTWSPFVFT